MVKVKEFCSTSLNTKEVSKEAAKQREPRIVNRCLHLSFTLLQRLLVK